MAKDDEVTLNTLKERVTKVAGYELEKIWITKETALLVHDVLKMDTEFVLVQISRSVLQIKKGDNPIVTFESIRSFYPSIQLNRANIEHFSSIDSLQFLKQSGIYWYVEKLPHDQMLELVNEHIKSQRPHLRGFSKDYPGNNAIPFKDSELY